MSSLNSYFESDFNTLREEWEKGLLSELKLSEIGTKGMKKTPHGTNWPTLSLETKSEIQLASSEWKKASSTYFSFYDQDVRSVLQNDYEAGVRDFFIHGSALTDEKWKALEEALANRDDVEVFILDGKRDSTKLKVVDEFISGKKFHDLGGHSVHELALMAHDLIKGLETKGTIYLAVYVDSLFFHDIAKLRAARLLGEKILQEAKDGRALKVVALTSYTGWTLFERYSNMLRNETAVAASYIGGADHVQSSGYNAIYELEAEGAVGDEHVERSWRMARNTSHVLGLESMLGVVGDAAYGSFHLENLTASLCEEAWRLMQSLLMGADILEDVGKVREERLLKVKTRKSVLSGVNDYPDVKEALSVKLKPSTYFRVARPFEDLRLRMEKLNKPEVAVLLHGDYAALNARLNFVKNYFELLGLKVKEITTLPTSQPTGDIVVFCALDEDYPKLVELTKDFKSSHQFIAGKFEAPGKKNLFAGQNVYEVLEDLVASFGGGRS